VLYQLSYFRNTWNCLSFGSFGAENETRTRDPDLGKVVLYQLSYFRNFSKAGAKITRLFANAQTFFEKKL
jgi:hypothetical protein